jgi:hypothetical protein
MSPNIWSTTCRSNEVSNDINYEFRLTKKIPESILYSVLREYKFSRERSKELSFVSVYRVSFVRSINILMWIFELYHVIQLSRFTIEYLRVLLVVDIFKRQP